MTIQYTLGLPEESELRRVIDSSLPWLRDKLAWPKDVMTDSERASYLVARTSNGFTLSLYDDGLLVGVEVGQVTANGSVLIDTMMWAVGQSGSYDWIDCPDRFDELPSFLSQIKRTDYGFLVPKGVGFISWLRDAQGLVPDATLPASSLPYERQWAVVATTFGVI